MVKIKSLTTDEIGLNEALAEAGIEAIETDLAELIIQLAGERSSHILVPAIHKNRSEIRALFQRRLGVASLTDEPRALAAAARDAPAAEVPRAPGSPSAGPTSASPRPARSASSSPRATAGCA